MPSLTPASVDVLVPVFNGEATVRASVESMREQTLNDIRIVIVDDGSTDGTSRILAELAAQDARVQVVATANGGIVEALNRGLAICTAEFVARHDADDVAFPERLERQLDYLLRHRDCIAVGCNVLHIDAKGERTGARSNFAGDVAPDPDAVPSREPYLMHPFLFARRDALAAAGGYRHVSHAEDTDLYWRLHARGRLHNLADVLGEYRVHDASISSASILNGRIAAVSSQLAAVSFRRRAKGAPDIEFPRDAIARYAAARTFAAILDAACAGLDAKEAAYLRVASAAKLVALLVYRPYLPDVEDCRFIRTTIERGSAVLSPADAATHRKLLGLVGLRLLRHRRFDLLRELRPPPASVGRMLASRSLRKGLEKTRRLIGFARKRGVA